MKKEKEEQFSMRLMLNLPGKLPSLHVLDGAPVAKEMAKAEADRSIMDRLESYVKFANKYLWNCDVEILSTPDRKVVANYTISRKGIKKSDLIHISKEQILIDFETGYVGLKDEWAFPSKEIKEFFLLSFPKVREEGKIKIKKKSIHIDITIAQAHYEVGTCLEIMGFVQLALYDLQNKNWQRLAKNMETLGGLSERLSWVPILSRAYLAEKSLKAASKGGNSGDNKEYQKMRPDYQIIFDQEKMAHPTLSSNAIVERVRKRLNSPRKKPVSARTVKTYIKTK